MTNKIALTHVSVDYFEADRWVVMGADADGREYVLNDDHGLRAMPEYKAQAVVAKINAAGKVINPMLWSCRAPYGTSAWMLDGMEERMIEDERMFGW